MTPLSAFNMYPLSLSACFLSQFAVAALGSRVLKSLACVVPLSAFLIACVPTPIVKYVDSLHRSNTAPRAVRYVVLQPTPVCDARHAALAWACLLIYIYIPMTNHQALVLDTAYACHFPGFLCSSMSECCTVQPFQPCLMRLTEQCICMPSANTQ